METEIMNLDLRLKQFELFGKLAKQFTAAKAFPKYTAEQLFVLMKAGQEMGMQEMEAINSLYIVNGKVELYGKGMLSILTRDGWEIAYKNETPNQVTVVIKKGDRIIQETVTDKDQIIQRSKAAGFAKKNKLRFHGIRMILSFHLPHLISGAQDSFEADYVDYVIQQKEENDIDTIQENQEIDRMKKFIEQSDTVEKLESIGEIPQELEEMYYRKLQSL